MRHRSVPGTRGTRRRGVTLLELIVVLALLGLVLAIAAPTFIVPSERQESELAKLVGSARRAAILRGEPVTVVLDGNAWRIDGDANPAAPPIATGSIGSPVGTFRLHVSPIGTCIAESDDEAAVPTWNALECRIASTVEARAR